MNSSSPDARSTDLQLAAYGAQVATHLLTRRLTITAAQCRQQSPVPGNRGPSRCRTAAVTVVTGLHLAEACEGGLQHAISGCLGDRAMIAKADAAGADWRLFYGGRERASMAFISELAQYGDRVIIVPQDEQGMLDLESVLGTPRQDTLVYCCGPEGLLAAVEKFCEKWPPGSLHLERFSAKPQEPSEAADSAFELVLQRSGLTLEVPPDKSVLTVIREAGVSVLASCLEGVCGTCETEVIDGDVDHRDSVLNEEEQASNEYMMVCVSRCRSPQLVLDL